MHQSNYLIHSQMLSWNFAAFQPYLLHQVTNPSISALQFKATVRDLLQIFISSFMKETVYGYPRTELFKYFLQEIPNTREKLIYLFAFLILSLDLNRTENIWMQSGWHVCSGNLKTSHSVTSYFWIAQHDILTMRFKKNNFLVIYIKVNVD